MPRVVPRCSPWRYSHAVGAGTTIAGKKHGGFAGRGLDVLGDSMDTILGRYAREVKNFFRGAAIWLKIGADARRCAVARVSAPDPTIQVSDRKRCGTEMLHPSAAWRIGHPGRLSDTL